MNKIQIQSARGTQDILPPISKKWQIVENIITKIFDNAGIGEIRTPIFEHTELFLRSVGESSDIVNKELYTFLDRSDRSLSLRPEGTAGVARAYITNKLSQSPRPLKLWYKGAMFRYERSQTGRYRQFHQLGLEIYGSSSIYADYECIQLAMQIFKTLGLGEYITLEINSLGDSISRQNYQKVLREFLIENENIICDDCKKRTITNPLRALDCKNERDQELYSLTAPKLDDYLSEESKERLEQLYSLLNSDNSINCKINKNLVRGLDYYNDIVFEVKLNLDILGQQNTICAGGRYDNLINEFGGRELPAFGWAIGMERLVHTIEHLEGTGKINNLIPEQNICYLIDESNNFEEFYKVIIKLRENNIITIYDYDRKNIHSQFKQAKKQNPNIIIHYHENNDFVVRDMRHSNSGETKINIKNIDDLIKYI